MKCSHSVSGSANYKEQCRELMAADREKKIVFYDAHFFDCILACWLVLYKMKWFMECISFAVVFL